MEHDWNTILYVVIAVIAMVISALGKKKERSQSRTNATSSYDPMEEPQNSNPFGDFDLKGFFGENENQQAGKDASDEDEGEEMDRGMMREEPGQSMGRQYQQYAGEEESPTLKQAYSNEKTLADTIKYNEGRQSIKLTPEEYEHFRDENEIRDVIAETSIKGEGENDDTTPSFHLPLREAVIYSEILNRKEF